MDSSSAIIPLHFIVVSMFVTARHILGGWASLFVKTRASQAVDKLLDLQPKTATVIVDGGEVIRSVDDLMIGDIVRVRPGERIPIDGMIIRGNSTVDESIVTGESMSVGKGDGVVGGSINLFGSIDIVVSRVGEETFLQQVVKYVEEAKALKPSVLIIVDKVLNYFVPFVLVISITSFLFWSLGSRLIFGALV